MVLEIQNKYLGIVIFLVKFSREANDQKEIMEHSDK